MVVICGCLVYIFSEVLASCGCDGLRVQLHQVRVLLRSLCFVLFMQILLFPVATCKWPVGRVVVTCRGNPAVRRAEVPATVF